MMVNNNLKPTDNQLNTVFFMTRWILPRDLGKAATDFLKVAASRKEVSAEIARLENLKKARRLQTKEDVFLGDVWKDFGWRDFCHE